VLKVWGALPDDDDEEEGEDEDEDEEDADEPEEAEGVFRTVHVFAGAPGIGGLVPVVDEVDGVSDAFHAEGSAMVGKLGDSSSGVFTSEYRCVFL